MGFREVSVTSNPSNRKETMERIPQDLLDILVCPKCKTSVVQEGDTLRCTHADCGLSYPIRDGIPVMLIEEATSPAQKPDPR
jgi:uncharacterized protein YbaR (Trm112 family)